MTDQETLKLTDDTAHDHEALELNDSTLDDELMLTTMDNPFSPKTDYDNWSQWDNDNGYYTEAYIARLIEMESDVDIDDEFQLNIITSKVIAEILVNDDQEIYCLV